MVIFDQLRVSDDGRRLYINFHVNNADYFDGITLKRLTITTADKVLETDPHTPSEDYIYKKDYGEGVREDALVLTAADFNERYSLSDMGSTLFFVYVECQGAPGECTPCRLDERTTLGVTFDESLLYQKVMQYTKSLADTCEVPVGFTDFILLWNAFKASVETEHYIPAIKYYNRLFDNTSAQTTSKRCRCNG